jgi:hypothetical protein
MRSRLSVIEAMNSRSRSRSASGSKRSQAGMYPRGRCSAGTPIQPSPAQHAPGEPPLLQLRRDLGHRWGS